MQYVNVPDALPENVYYATFFSRLYNHALGYCVYLPAAALQKACPAHYHFHGWQGQECSDVFAMEPVYQNGETIFVFPNVSYELEGQTNLPVERMVFEELIPEIERKYQAAGRRSISGFSMGGGMAVWFSLRHPAHLPKQSPTPALSITITIRSIGLRSSPWSGRRNCIRV